MNHTSRQDPLAAHKLAILNDLTHGPIAVADICGISKSEYSHADDDDNPTALFYRIEEAARTRTRALSELIRDDRVELRINAIEFYATIEEGPPRVPCAESRCRVFASLLNFAKVWRFEDPGGWVHPMGCTAIPFTWVATQVVAALVVR